MHQVRAVALAAGAALLLATAGCAEPGGTSPDQRPQLRLYGTDATMSNAFGGEFADRSILSGMKGTTPLTVLSPDFIRRLQEVDPSLEDYTYAGETYDAVVISALAAELAGTPDPARVRQFINGVTTGGQQCTVVADCLELARDGVDLEYRGVSLRRGGFTDAGEPSTATYATLHFNGDGRIDPGKTEFVGSGDAANATAEDPPRPSPRPNQPSWLVEPLKLGGLLPATGALAHANPPLLAGARLAVQEINEAGGVYGTDVEWVDGDDGTNPDVARQTVADHLAEGVHVIIGAGASGVSRAVLADVVAAQRILFSPSNTAADLTDADDDGFYFRTAPSDLLQASALADILMRDGAERIAIVARDDAYGAGLQSHVRDALERFGVPSEDLLTLRYDVPGEDGSLPELATLVDRVHNFTADAVLVIGFGEAAQFIQAMVDADATAR